ncbi:MAG: DUF4330 domain-containing protein [Defluviitaleaceae bacterium]|nr:DUF4330 domain-containing protein [Defluviitaleaceae bacterium]
MIDNKGRLFGKVSLVDLFAAVVFAAVFFVVFNAVRADDRLEMGEEQSVVITFFSPTAYGFVADAFRHGVSVTDSERRVPLGQVINVEVGDSRFFLTDRQGNEVVSHREGYASVHISSRVTARLTDGAAVIGGVVYAVGSEVYIWAGDVWLITHISDISEG